LTPINR